MTSQPKDSIESLLASLEQAVEERKRSDRAIADLKESFSGSTLVLLQQAVEDREHSDKTLAAIRDSLAERIGQMNQAKMMVDSIMGTVATTPSTAQAHDNALTLNVRNIGTFILHYILPAVIMLAVTWFVLSWLNQKDSNTTTSFAVPAMRLTESAIAQSPMTDIIHFAVEEDVIQEEFLLSNDVSIDTIIDDSIIDEPTIEDDISGIPLDEEKAEDASAEKEIEILRNNRERRLPLIQRIRR